MFRYGRISLKILPVSPSGKGGRVALGTIIIHREVACHTKLPLYLKDCPVTSEGDKASIFVDRMANFVWPEAIYCSENLWSRKTRFNNNFMSPAQISPFTQPASRLTFESRASGEERVGPLALVLQREPARKLRFTALFITSA